MRRRAHDPLGLAALTVALVLLASGTIGVAARAGGRPTVVAAGGALSGPIAPLPSASPPPPPDILDDGPAVSSKAGSLPNPSILPVSTPHPTPTPENAGRYTDEELQELAATLTDGTIFMSGGGFGATKKSESAGIKIETDVYPVGGTIDSEGRRETQHHWRVWTDRLVRFVAIDYGDGTTWESGERVYWTCEANDRPYPYHLSLPNHTWATSGAFTITATLTTTSCDRKDEAGSYGDDVQTHTLSMRFVMPDGWMVHPNNSNYPGVMCTDAAQTCGDLPDRYRRPGTGMP